MKCSELKQLVERAISFRAPEPGSGDQAWAVELFALLDTAPDQSVKAIAKAIGSLKIEEVAHSSQIANLCAFLDALALLLSGHAKSSALQEIHAFVEALRRQANSDISTLAAALSKPKSRSTRPQARAPNTVREEIVSKYSRRLEEALGDDEGFNSVFAMLENDKELSAGEVAAIAKKFTQAAPKGRPAALKKIFARHQAIMTSRAKSAATAGRIAG